MNPNTDPVDYALARQAAGVTIGALFARCVRRAPGRIALQQGPHGLTYAQLDEPVSYDLADVLAAPQRTAARRRS